MLKYRISSFCHTKGYMLNVLTLLIRVRLSIWLYGLEAEKTSGSFRVLRKCFMQVWLLPLWQHTDDIL